MTHFLCAVGWHDRRYVEDSHRQAPTSALWSGEFSCTRCAGRWAWYTFRTMRGDMGSLWVRIPE